MKKIYWRPSSVPRVILVVIAIIGISGMSSVELFKAKIRQPYYGEKIRAARAMNSGMEFIRKYRLRNVGPIDPETDPADSGMIGLATSPITSTTGYLKVKQTTINPNWAAVLVDMLKRAGVKEGDAIASTFSGSFPAISLAVLTAAETLRLKVIAISSVAASNWGANIPDLTWLDLERILHEQGIISHRSVAASLGGEEDKALGMKEHSREMLRSAIERNGVRLIEIDNLKENIVKKMSIYKEFSEGKRISAYVNVGGGTIAVGSVKGKKLYQPGLNKRPSPEALRVDSVMTRFAREGVPVIHMIYIDRLAEKYGLPKSPQMMPHIGEGDIFTRLTYNLYLASFVLVVLIFILYVFLRRDIGFRIFGSHRITHAPKHPEPMV
ncbi:MAG: poly-gamma-glutamate system protein [Desulfobacteraceae bacterium]|nr:MAG: poly-gamma-glutamate system protein [Desulfobacteraceae bacterium]